MVLLLFISIIISVCFALVFLSYSSTDFTFFDKNTEEKRLILLVISLLIILLGLLFAFWSSSKNPSGWGAMQKPQLLLGMIAIFTYVGVEVTYTKQFGRIIEGSS